MRRIGLYAGALLMLAACGEDPKRGEGGSSDGADPSTPGTKSDRADESGTPRDPKDYVGRSWGNGVEGLLQFRGNPTHTFYGVGPVPTAPRVLWRFPDAPMCGESRVGGRAKTWCGSGWTGQPVVWERPDGVTEAIFGAYDKAVHFVDVRTGLRTRPDFMTGDIIKGSVSLDPDGFPLLYFGSRDNKLRIVALDRPAPTELWALDAYAVSPVIWNNDWDGNPSIVNDVLYEGGENSWFFAIKLNRRYDDDGRVAVDPHHLVEFPGWTDALLEQIGDRTVSIENSVALFENRVYFANGGGRVVGLDTTHVLDGEAPVVFDYWVGDDVDASIVIDEDGMIYVSVEHERFLPRSDEVGQLVKLDPYDSENPLRWSVHAPGRPDGDVGGLWATPALGDGVLYAPTHEGKLLAVDRANGEVVWEDTIGWHAWSSPAVVDGKLVLGTCNGSLRIYDLTDPRQPSLVGSTRLESGGCIESTPAVWKGRILVGSRDGYFYAFGE